MDFFNLDGCVALVTGGARGIGAAALALAEAGANVGIVGHVQDPEETRLSIEKMGRCSLAFRGDLADAGFQDKVVREYLRNGGISTSW